MKRYWSLGGVVGVLAAVLGGAMMTNARPIAQQAPAHLALMPMPASVKPGTGRVPITTSTTVALRGFQDDRLRAAVQRAMRRLESRTGYMMARGFRGRHGGGHAGRRLSGRRARPCRRWTRMSRTD